MGVNLVPDRLSVGLFVYIENEYVHLIRWRAIIC
jgi:hypothetical protein